MFSYKPLLKLLVDKNMTKTQLREQLGISMATLAKISKNEYISMKVLDDICSLLNCKIEDIVEHQPRFSIYSFNIAFTTIYNNYS